MSTADRNKRLLGPNLLKVRVLSRRRTAIELLEMTTIGIALCCRMVEVPCRARLSRLSVDKQESNNCLFWKTVGEKERKEWCCGHVMLDLALSQGRR